ncbi:hypothetical protein [Acidimangrovimonas sediminis]|uniref:hypothetical protein n=1 Tax=Acidimangrovimonas sediminis TaxID=2056283 RepID=UPI000C808312|nr:hypothetical protein [Acidimangrovimonas sediminis]
MERKSRQTGTASARASSSREERLKAALKANIARRKAQARERDAGAGPDAGNEADDNTDPAKNGNNEA